MDFLYTIVKGVMDMGASVMLPIVLTLVGICFRMKITQALKAGLYVGIGFQGVGLVIGFLTTTIQPAIEYYAKMGSGFTTLDLAWPAIGAASWAGPYAAIACAAGMLLNVVLVRMKWVKVLNVDIWNYSHFLIAAGMAYAWTGSIMVGFAVTVGLSVWTLFCAQWSAKDWQEQFGLEGTCCSTLTFVAYDVWLCKVMNWIMDKIPGLNKIDVNIDKINKRFGFIADPCIVGLLIGVLLGVITRQSIMSIVAMGVGIAAIIVLLPRMVNLFMEGLAPIGTAASEYMFKKMGDDAEIMIGMDICLGLGDPCALTATIICIPICILLAFLLPNMSYFPIGVVTGICYSCVMPTAVSKGNLLRTVIMVTVLLALGMTFTNMIAPQATAFVSSMGVKIDGLATGMCIGQNPYSAAIAFLWKMF